MWNDKNQQVQSKDVKSTSENTNDDNLDNNRQDANNKNDNPLNKTVFVLNDFNGDLFKQVYTQHKSILGLTAFKYFLINQKNVSAFDSFCSNIFLS